MYCHRLLKITSMLRILLYLKWFSVAKLNQANCLKSSQLSPILQWGSTNSSDWCFPMNMYLGVKIINISCIIFFTRWKVISRSRALYIYVLAYEYLSLMNEYSIRVYIDYFYSLHVWKVMTITYDSIITVVRLYRSCRRRIDKVKGFSKLNNKQIDSLNRV